MKDFPVFTTEYGVASLVLREIPYQGCAYVTILDSREPALLLQECVSFCRMCGAESVYAKGHPYLERYPLYTVLLKMRAAIADLADTDAALWPVQEQTLEQWRGIYNHKVKRIPNGAWMTEKAAKEMLQKGEGYFVHRDKMLLGIGKVSGETLEWVASVYPGAGADVVCTLAHAVSGDAVTLTVANNNEKARKLYERLGFLPVQEVGRWYIVHKIDMKIL